MERVTLVYPGFSCIRYPKMYSQPLLLPISMQTKQDPRDPAVLLMALKKILHAKM